MEEIDEIKELLNIFKIDIDLNSREENYKIFTHKMNILHIIFMRLEKINEDLINSYDDEYNYVLKTPIFEREYQ